MPDTVRRRLLMPIITNGLTRGAFIFLAHPIIATVLFVGARWRQAYLG